MRKYHKRKKKINSTRLGMVAITFVVLILCGVLSIQIAGLRKRTAILEEKKTQLEQDLEEENERTLELEDERVYVQTKEYIEQVAKSRGYIYPNEIIFRPANR